MFPISSAFDKKFIKISGKKKFSFEIALEKFSPR